MVVGAESGNAARHGCARDATEEKKIQDGRISRSPVNTAGPLQRRWRPFFAGPDVSTHLLRFTVLAGLSRTQPHHSSIPPQLRDFAREEILMTNPRFLRASPLPVLRPCDTDQSFPKVCAHGMARPATASGHTPKNPTDHAERDIEHGGKPLAVLKETKRLILKRGERRISPMKPMGIRYRQFGFHCFFPQQRDDQADRKILKH